MNLFYFFPSGFCPLLSLCVLDSRCTMKNLQRNLQEQNWVILIVSCRSPDLTFKACTLLDLNWFQRFAFFASFFFCFLFLPTSLPEFGPICLTMTSCQHVPVTKSYLKFQRITTVYIVLSSFIFFNHNIYRNVLKNRFEAVELQRMKHERWMWCRKCPFPLVLKLCHFDHSASSIFLHGGAQLCPFQ